jgi:hypothetical protein
LELYDDDYKYYYCTAEHILFRNNRKGIHHRILNGDIYLSELIYKYTLLNGKTFDAMPTFPNKDICYNLIMSEKFSAKWLSMISPEECCVCFEPTYLLTNCGHPLCEKCKPQLTHTLCPLCRQFVYIQESEAARKQMEAEIQQTNDDVI